ncbi:Pentatricopeptide repeat-containing protein [Symbiodinium microadriaticum]|uniref:Pentatricopeptide repeat-containing protein n=1 Tax=Symbiodinium microadriaticum TaxID=2951 RepID=A0A1Q9CI71_SYMMI|nr:Pentatricopeptide repeat-containing protein [Symbiodinium microadriaticum]
MFLQLARPSSGNSEVPFSYVSVFMNSTEAALTHSFDPRRQHGLKSCRGSLDADSRRLPCRIFQRAPTVEEQALLQTHMDERDTQRAAEGLTVRSPTPEQEFRDRYFDKLKKQGVFRRPWLPFGEYLVSKQKGGEAYARRHDKPRPNLLATSTSSTS